MVTLLQKTKAVKLRFWNCVRLHSEGEIFSKRIGERYHAAHIANLEAECFTAFYCYYNEASFPIICFFPATDLALFMSL